MIHYSYKELKYSEGKILNKNNYEIMYDANTTYGSSGSPIFLKDSKEVIAIHRGHKLKEKKKFGILIYPFMQSLLLTIKKQIRKVYENGEYYIGEFKNDLRHGKGILYHKNGNSAQKVTYFL